VLLRHAETVLAQLRLAEAEVLAATGVERPRLRVGAFPSAAASIMPPALAELRAAHPEADVAMRVIEDAPALDALRRGELDLAMVLDSELSPIELPPGIEAFAVLDDPLLIALPYSHPLAGRSAISLADLRDGQAWIAFSYDGGDLDPEHGGPARLLVPHLYFWKSAKWVRGLRLRDTDEPGFWENYGYHMYGDPWREQRYQGD
jgi:DNA-binding transcriptional LysR family regulator